MKNVECNLNIMKALLISTAALFISTFSFAQDRQMNISDSVIRRIVERHIDAPGSVYKGKVGQALLQVNKANGRIVVHSLYASSTDYDFTAGKKIAKAIEATYANCIPADYNVLIPVVFQFDDEGPLPPLALDKKLEGAMKKLGENVTVLKPIVFIAYPVTRCSMVKAARS